MDQDKIFGYLNMMFQREISILRHQTPTWSISIPDNESKKRITYENGDTLIDIFSNLKTDEEKEYFKSQIAAGLSRYDEEYWQDDTSEEIFASGISALSFYTLIRIGDTSQALKSSWSRFSGRNCILLLRFLLDLFSEEYNYFKIEDLNEITRLLSQLDRSSGLFIQLRDQLLQKVTEYGFSIVKNEIRGVNIEINRDKESVINKISVLGMGKEYEDFLVKLDQEISTSSGLITSGMIGNFRTFWEQLVVELSKKICLFSGEEMPAIEGKSQISISRLFIKRMLGLSDADNSLISRFVDILHAEGGHAFTSNFEYFRLSRNIGIEILLLLLTKTETLKVQYKQ